MKLVETPRGGPLLPLPNDAVPVGFDGDSRIRRGRKAGPWRLPLSNHGADSHVRLPDKNLKENFVGGNTI